MVHTQDVVVCMQVAGVYLLIVVGLIAVPKCVIVFTDVEDGCQVVAEIEFVRLQ